MVKIIEATNQLLRTIDESSGYTKTIVLAGISVLALAVLQGVF